MKTYVTNKTALVTGAGRRIGRAIAMDLARKGWVVIVHYNSSIAEAEKTVNTIKARDGMAYAIKGDLANTKEAARLVSIATELAGPLGCLINNASVFEQDEIETATLESWNVHMDVNLRAPVFLTQAFVRQCEVDCRASIINVIDERVWNLTPHFMSYSTSKAGLWTLTKTLALALAPQIRVNGIGPGPTLPSPRQSKEQFESQCRSLPLGHGASLEEICEAVHFLLCASSVTGQMLVLDGGQHLGWKHGTDTDMVQE